MEPNQVHLVAAAVSCDSQQVIHAVEPRLTRQIVRDVRNGNRRNRIDDDVALVHRVTATHLYVGTRPDANAASDSPAPDSFAKALGEDQWNLTLPSATEFACGTGSCEEIKHIEHHVLGIEVLDRRHGAHGGTTEIAGVKCAGAVAWSAAVMAQGESPR